MPATYTLIASNTLTSTSASVTFSSIPGTYTDLVLRMSVRSDAAFAGGNANESFSVELNGSSSANYSTTILYGTGIYGGTQAAASTRISGATYWDIYASNGSLTTTSTFNNVEIYIPSYTSSNNKPASVFDVTESNSATNNWVGAQANLWRVTSAITSIKIANNISGNNFVSGSSFFLYGIKNS